MAKLRDKPRSKPVFKYQRRSPDVWREKAKETSSNFDRFVHDKADKFSPRDGDNRIRILPPTWEDADDWGYPIYVHYGVGADNGQYLCLKLNELARTKELDERCPVCDEVEYLKKSGDQADAKRIAAKLRKACWLIDRKDADSSGPKFWAMPFTLARDANASAQDEDGGIMELDNPDGDEGYDLLFTKETKGSKEFTDYIAVKPTRKATPLSKDEDEQAEWLAYIQKYPVPEMLRFYDADHIAAVLSGQLAHSRDDDSDDDDDNDDEEVQEKPRRSVKSSKRVVDDDDEDLDDKNDDVEEGDEEDEEDEKPRRRIHGVALFHDDDVEDTGDDDDDDDDGKSSVKRRLEKVSQRASRSK